MQHFRGFFAYAQNDRKFETAHKSEFEVVFVGAIINRPVILLKQNHIALAMKILFPAEIPIICAQIIGRADNIRPYDVVRSCLSNRNLKLCS